MIPKYPESVELSMELRDMLHPMFQKLSGGISEFTFAGLYLFRKVHNYKISAAGGNTLVIIGDDKGDPFFMCPFDLPDREFLETLFLSHITMKCASREQVQHLKREGFYATPDRDNFDYLYTREGLADLSGRKYHKKRNLIKAFVNNHSHEGKPLLEEFIPHAIEVLEKWQNDRGDEGDYLPAREALEKSENLQLCGGIYYVDNKPVGYTLGEEIDLGKQFVIHFEKAVDGYKGLYQFINQAFASIITEHYELINREQDLGGEGLRRAKMSYKPIGFVEKYIVRK